MTVRVHEQRKMKTTVDELFKAYEDGEILKRELLTLGFFERARKPTLVIMENPDLELYVKIEIFPGGKISGYEILTFDEIEDTLR